MKLQRARNSGDERVTGLVHRSRSQRSRTRLLAGALTVVAMVTASSALATTWTLMRTPRSPSSYLFGVSCTSPSACSAVGYTGVGSATTLAEGWNGRRWTIQSTPIMRDGGQFDAVSCTAENACIAVGDRNTLARDGKTGTATLAKRWNGRRWTIQSGPSLSVSFGSLYGVSCASARACIASGNPSLAERYR